MEWNGSDDARKCDINKVRLMSMKMRKNKVITTFPKCMRLRAHLWPKYITRSIETKYFWQAHRGGRRQITIPEKRLKGPTYKQQEMVKCIYYTLNMDEVGIPMLIRLSQQINVSWKLKGEVDIKA
jgi:hypothetical protein